MRRREFIAGIGSAGAWPVLAQGQQPTMPVIGYLDSRSAGRTGGAAKASCLVGLRLVGEDKPLRR
jgi:hypothetical protein